MSKKSKKKKRQNRKYHFINDAKQQSPTAASASISSVDSNAKQNSVISKSDATHKQQPKKLDPTDELFARNAIYMKNDARRSLMFSGAIIIFLFVLWSVFSYTSVGDNIYNIIKL